MQIIVGIALFIVIVTVIIYKVNDKFEKREFLIFLAITFFAVLVALFYENYSKNQLPNIFKKKYEKEKSIEIRSLDSELLNNKVVSSKDKFIYKFTYTISKDDSEYLCTMNSVEIHKIKNEFIFINFDDIKEECIKK